MDKNKVIGLGIVLVGVAGAIGYYIYSSKKAGQISTPTATFEAPNNTPPDVSQNNSGKKKNNQGQHVSVSAVAVRSFGSEQYSSNPILNLRNR